MSVQDYSTTPSSNTTIAGINIGEGCAPANLNNAIRQLMADLATWSDGLVVGEDVQAYSAKLKALADLTWAANKLIYATGTGTLSTSDLTAFARTLLDDANAAAMLVTLDLKALATKDKAAVGDIDATGTPGAGTLLYGDAVWRGAVGVGQTLQDVTASRALATSYQNTTGVPIVIDPRLTTVGASHVVVETSTNNSTWITARKINHNVGSTYTDCSMGPVIVPTGHYYRCRSVSGSNTLVTWMEWRP